MSSSSHNASWVSLLKGGQVRSFQSGDVITSPSNTENLLFVVESGRARICLYGAAKEQSLGFLDVGSIFVTHTPVWVEAIASTSIKHWPIRDIKSLFTEHPQLALGAFQDVGRLLQNTIQLVEDLAFRTVESRLARFLVSESQRHHSLRITLPGNTETIANLLGTSRQTLSSIMNKLEAEALIERPERQQVMIKDVARLEHLSDSS